MLYGGFIIRTKHYNHMWMRYQSGLGLLLVATSLYNIILVWRICLTKVWWEGACVYISDDKQSPTKSAYQIIVKYKTKRRKKASTYMLISLPYLRYGDVESWNPYYHIMIMIMGWKIRSSHSKLNHHIIHMRIVWDDGWVPKTKKGWNNISE